MIFANNLTNHDVAPLLKYCVSRTVEWHNGVISSNDRGNDLVICELIIRFWTSDPEIILNFVQLCKRKLLK